MLVWLIKKCEISNFLSWENKLKKNLIYFLLKLIKELSLHPLRKRSENDKRVAERLSFKLVKTRFNWVVHWHIDWQRVLRFSNLFEIY